MRRLQIGYDAWDRLDNGRFCNTTIRRLKREGHSVPVFKRDKCPVRTLALHIMFNLKFQKCAILDMGFNGHTEMIFTD